MNWKTFITSGALAASLIVAGNAQAQTVTPGTGVRVPGQMLPAQRPPGGRGERGSARNVRFELRHLEKAIDALQRDRHDFGGHREAAIDLLQRARTELNAALQYDAAHPGQ